MIIIVLVILVSMTSVIKIKPIEAENTIIVPDDYPTIQEAINAASPGDTIYVKAGTYYEHVIVNKSITLHGEDPETTKISRKERGYNVVKVTADYVTITNLSIIGARGTLYSRASSIYVKSSSYCNISGNYISSSSYGDGLVLYSSSDNTIQGNTISGDLWGLVLYDSGRNTISNNTIGTYFKFSSSGNNEIMGNTINCEMDLTWSYDNIFFSNNIYGGVFYGSAIWDNGYPIGGNYWSDYVGVDEYSGSYQNETGSDGIGDTPHVFYSQADHKNVDHYPLMYPIIQTDHPIPVIVSIDYPGSIDLGEWANITITARNDGTTAEWQTIHVSFPTDFYGPDAPLQSPVPLENIEIVSHDLNGGAEIYPPGTELPAAYGESTVISDYAMVEGVHGPWRGGRNRETHTMTIRVKSQELNPELPPFLMFFVKTVSRANNMTYSDPGGGITLDQQNEHVYVHGIRVNMYPSIEVVEIKYEPWNPLVTSTDVDESINYIEVFEQSPFPWYFGQIPIETTIANNGDLNATGVSIDARMTGDISMIVLDPANISNDRVVSYHFDYTETVFTSGTIGVGDNITEVLMLPIKYITLVVGAISLPEPDTNEMIPLDIVVSMVSVHVTLTIKGNFDDVIYEIPEDIVGIGDPNDLLKKWNTQLSRRVQEKEVRIFLETYYSQLGLKVPVIHIDHDIPTGIYETTVPILPGTTKTVLTLAIPAGITLLGFALLPWGATTPIGGVLIAAGLAMLVLNNPTPGNGTVTIQTASPELNMTLEVVQMIPQNVQTIDHIVEKNGKTFHIITTSNSTISNFEFNGTSISFTVTDSDTVGFCHISIAKALMDNNITVYVNDNPITEFILSENVTHTMIYFTYPHPSNILVIPEFPMWMMLPLFMILTLLVAVFLIKTRKNKSEQPPSIRPSHI